MWRFRSASTESAICCAPGRTRRPAPGYCAGTRSTALKANQASGSSRASASSRVGAIRASTGPPIRVRLRGRAGLPSSAISAVAASTATAGCDTASRCAPGPIASSQAMTCATMSSRPKGPAATGISRASVQSVTCTSCSGSRVSTVPRSRVAKWPDCGATTSTRGPGLATSLAKRSSRPKGAVSTTSSRTSTRPPPCRSGPRPKAGLRWVVPAPSSSWKRGRRLGQRQGPRPAAGMQGPQQAGGDTGERTEPGQKGRLGLVELVHHGCGSWRRRGGSAGRRSSRRSDDSHRRMPNACNARDHRGTHRQALQLPRETPGAVSRPPRASPNPPL